MKIKYISMSLIAGLIFSAEACFADKKINSDSADMTAADFYSSAALQEKKTGTAFVYGKVSDFSGNPVSGADIRIKNRNFENIYSTKSDLDGNYRLPVSTGVYSSLYACKDYGEKNLEYWAWNVTVSSDTEINPRFNGLEVYALNAFELQKTPAYMQIYFRPMSLQRTRLAGGREKVADTDFIDISPKLEKADIKVTINGEAAEVLGINRISEYLSGKQRIAAYLIQTELPENRGSDIWRIRVTVYDRETKEYGESCLFWKKPSAR